MSTAEHLGEWGTHIRAPSGASAIAAVAALVLGGAALLATLGGAIGIVLAVAWVAGLSAWVFVQGRLALRKYGAVRVTPRNAPRLSNIALGLGERLSVGPVALWAIPDGGPNALVCRAGGRAIAATQSLLDGYGRTELEAAVCHCLVRSHARQTLAASCASALGRIGSGLAPRVGGVDDTLVCTITRYPPALASALRRSVPVNDRFAPMWMAAAGPSHVPNDRRIADLEDL